MMDILVRRVYKDRCQCRDYDFINHNHGIDVCRNLHFIDANHDIDLKVAFTADSFQNKKSYFHEAGQGGGGMVYDENTRTMVREIILGVVWI